MSWAELRSKVLLRRGVAVATGAAGRVKVAGLRAQRHIVAVEKPAKAALQQPRSGLEPEQHPDRQYAVRA